MPFTIYYKPGNGQLTFTIPAKDRWEGWESLAALQECFGETNCGACNSTRIRWQVRSGSSNGKDWTFYEICCDDCSAKLEYGNFDGKLFPKRKAKDKSDLPNRGWVVYQRPAAQGQDQPPPAEYPQESYGGQEEVPY